ncbi:MAG TPA: ChbG/HpnK family deacetylase [Terracidiphilus sp.]|nr:ChbG/HpnK family deacetylase [Terracidiphilus sp.]
MSRLIVNADDFGLTSGVNRAIIELHQAGVLTSATLMAKAAATEEAIERARANPTLGVGCHVVLADGEPVLQASQIPSLIDRRTGRFHQTLGAFLARLFTGRIAAAEIEAEAAAQITSLQKRGIRLTHVDTHKHTHMFPHVLRAVLRAASAAGIHAVRNPFEPEWAVNATPRASWMRTGEVIALRRLGPYFRRLILQQGFKTTDGTIAMAGTGTFDASAARALLNQMPEGTWELVTHPGYNDADLAKIRTRLRESRDIERNALHALKEFPAIDLIAYNSLAPASIV